MRRAGGFTRSEQLDRAYENMNPEYKIYVWYDVAASIAEVQNIRAPEYEEIEQQRCARPTETTTRNLPWPPRTAERNAAGNVSSGGTRGLTARDRRKSSAPNADATGFLPRTAIRHRETHRAGDTAAENSTPSPA